MGTTTADGPRELSTGSPDIASTGPLPTIFTPEQAERGRRVFGSICSSCHGRNEFRGPIFQLTWMAEPVGNLFQQISTTMPYDEPGSLGEEEYAAIVAYMLDLNGRTPGNSELPVDTGLLSRMKW